MMSALNRQGKHNVLATIYFLYLCLTPIFGASLYPQINDGILDLRSTNLNELHSIPLTGDWEFYWDQLLTENDFDANLNIPITCYIDVPTKWSDIKINNVNLTDTGKATYRLKILLPENQLEDLGIQISTISSAYLIYANGTLISKTGIVSKTKSKAKPGYYTGIIPINSISDTLNIIIQVSNFHHNQGGILNNRLKFGLYSNLKRHWNFKVFIYIFLLGTIAIIIIYHLGIYLMNPSLNTTLCFALFCIAIAIRMVLEDDIYILHIINMNWNLLLRLDYIIIFAVATTFILYIESLYRNEINNKVTFVFKLLFLIYCVIVLFTTPFFFTKYLKLYLLSILASILYILYFVFVRIKAKDKLSQLLALGLIILFAAFVNDILYVNRIIDTIYLTTYGFVLFMINQAFLLSYRFQILYSEIKSLTIKNEVINKNLEKKVKQRTLEIESQKNLLVQKTKVIELHKINLEKEHSIVVNHKKTIIDSIQYAKKLQEAILPSKTIFNAHLKEYFIIYKPKDIVSGDFYWTSYIDDKLIIAVADCTGHGVPGALLSMLGIAFLSEISRIHSITSAAEYLEYLRAKIKHSLKQENKYSYHKDGIDMGICIYDKKNKKIQFAGGYNNLLMVRNNELIIFKGNKQPIAIHPKEVPFTNYDIDVNENDSFYLMSDGFVDQMGGKEGRKLRIKKIKEKLLQLQNKSMQEQKIILEELFENWKGKYPQIDDVLVLGFKLHDI